MRVRADQPGECLVITGSIIVEGISTDVTLTVNTIQLIHILGDKAARAKGRKSQVCSGLVKAKVDSTAHGIVQSVLKDKRKARAEHMAAAMQKAAERKAAGERYEPAEGDIKW